MVIDSKKYNGRCACSHEHTMVTNAAVIESGCLKHFEDYIRDLGLTGKRAAIYDENTYNAKNMIRPAAEQEIILNPENLHANEKATGAVLQQLDPDVKVLIAVGSGTIHDTTRYCANHLGLPFIACPTAASVDGFCSTVSAMTWQGYKKTMPGVAPIIVLADIDIIKEAPLELALSGIGDVLGKYTALADWKIANAITNEYLCPVIEDMTRKAVKAVHESSANICSRDPLAFEKLTYGLLLSGLAMQLMGNSRPASGAEHHVSHLIEMSPPSLGVHSDALHGEKVGVGTAIVSRAYHKLAEIEDISKHLTPYSPLSQEYLRKIFGEALLPSVTEENQNDCLSAVSVEALSKAWPAIREIITEIPTAEELEALYRKIGAKTTLEDLGVSSSLLPKLLEYSPCVRNRLTLMRIHRMIKV